MDVQQAQERIYSYFLELVRVRAPEEALIEFKNLFIYHASVKDAAILDYLRDVILDRREDTFKYTIQRSCYILFNNWEANRQYDYIQKLVRVFRDPAIQQRAVSPVLKRLRQQLKNFLKSREYRDLKLFVRRYDSLAGDGTKENWSDRYLAYLLVPQYANPNNPREQRDVARLVSQQLKDKFKFELAMYVTRSQSAGYDRATHPNPTVLGDGALRLIKMVVARKGQFGYENLANLFLEQTRNGSYRQFKKALPNYLMYAWGDRDWVLPLKAKLAAKTLDLYRDRDRDAMEDALVLRTCNRTIEFLTTENGRDPSSLFVLLLSHGNPLTLAISLLKLVLASRHSRIHLETCLAVLIRYYENLPESECEWVVRFFEIMKVIFAIYAEDVKYHLVRIRGGDGDCETLDDAVKRAKDIDAYRLFAQIKVAPPPMDLALEETRSTFAGDETALESAYGSGAPKNDEDEDEDTELETLFS